MILKVSKYQNLNFMALDNLNSVATLNDIESYSPSGGTVRSGELILFCQTKSAFR